MKKPNLLADLMAMVIAKPKKNHAKLVIVVDVEAMDDGPLVVGYKSGVLFDKKTTDGDDPQCRFLARLTKLFVKDVDILTDSDNK